MEPRVPVSVFCVVFLAAAAAVAQGEVLLGTAGFEDVVAGSEFEYGSGLVSGGVPIFVTSSGGQRGGPSGTAATVLEFGGGKLIMLESSAVLGFGEDNQLALGIDRLIVGYHTDERAVYRIFDQAFRITVENGFVSYGTESLLIGDGVAFEFEGIEAFVGPAERFGVGGYTVDLRGDLQGILLFGDAGFDDLAVYVPEPGTLGLLCVGLAGLTVRRRSGES